MAVIALHKCGKSDSQFSKFLKSLKISLNFVYRAIKPYKELRGAADRARLGRLRFVRAEAAIKTVQANSHIACRSHAAPMPFPCHAVR